MAPDALLICLYEFVDFTRNPMNFFLQRLATVSPLLLFLAACSPDTDRPNDQIDRELSAAGEPRPAVTAEDYRRAESFLSENTSQLLSGHIEAQYWQDNDTLLYRRTALAIDEYVLANPADGTQVLLFDSERLADLLEPFADEELDATDLSISRLDLGGNGTHLEFDYDDYRYRLDLATLQIGQLDELPDDEYLSPDGSRAAYLEDHNLWVRDAASGVRTQLTFDGVDHYGYATNNAGWLRDDGPVLLWSPDSSKIATFRHDGRSVEEMYLYTTEVGHGELDAWKYPLPGDADVAIMASNLPQYDRAIVARVVQRVHDALRPGGEFHLIGEMLDDDRRGPLAPALWGLSEAVSGSTGLAHTQGECIGYLGAAGFRDVAAHDFIPGTLTRVSGLKPG